MIILISPAKSLDFEKPAPLSEFSEMQFPEKAEYLSEKLKKVGSRKLKSMMDISENLAQLNVLRYRDMDFPMTLSNAKQAVYAFQGDVYQGLNAEELSLDEMQFAQSHLRILSGLYGILKPLDLIQPYRLEMGTSWKITQAKKNLYAFWKSTLTQNVMDELKSNNAPFVLNLASNEYSKAVDLKKLQTLVISPEFREEKDGEYKMISFFAKKARGLMTQFAIKNRISDPEQLLSFDLEGYGYNERLSNKDEYKWVFTRKSNN